MKTSLSVPWFNIFICKVWVFDRIVPSERWNHQNPIKMIKKPSEVKCQAISYEWNTISKLANFVVETNEWNNKIIWNWVLDWLRLSTNAFVTIYLRLDPTYLPETHWKWILFSICKYLSEGNFTLFDITLKSLFRWQWTSPSYSKVPFVDSLI